MVNASNYGGSAIFCGFVAVFAKPIVIDVAQLKQSIRFGGEPIFCEQHAQPQQPPAEANRKYLRSVYLSNPAS